MTDWRTVNAPYGFQQLATKLGVSTDDLAQNPHLVAAAVAQMEDPKGANHVAESFMDMVDRNGGGTQGLMKTLPAYDTMTMENGRTIGSLARGGRNMTIANINTQALQPTYQHLQDVASGKSDRVLPEGYTQNFSPAAARVQPHSPGSWQYYQDPKGNSIYAPTWASKAILGGNYTTTPGGEYMVPDNNNGDFKVSWSKPQGDPQGQTNVAANGAINSVNPNSMVATNNSSIATAPDPVQVASAAPAAPTAPAQSSDVGKSLISSVTGLNLSSPSSFFGSLAGAPEAATAAAPVAAAAAPALAGAAAPAVASAIGPAATAALGPAGMVVGALMGGGGDYAKQAAKGDAAAGQAAGGAMASSMQAAPKPHLALDPRITALMQKLASNGMGTNQTQGLGDDQGSQNFFGSLAG